MIQRKVELDALQSAVGSSHFITRVDWGRARHALFRLLYGLPSHSSVSLGCRALERYRPVFDVHWPDCTLAQNLLYFIKLWLEDRDEFALDRLRSSVDMSVCGGEECKFLDALEHMRLAALLEDGGSGAMAGLIAWSVYLCIEQRKENVLAADDPAAAEASRQFWRLKEQVMTTEDLKERRTLQARLTAFEEFLVGRRVDDNLAAAAVEWREWSLVVDWLRETVNRYPEITDEQALERDFVRWKESGEDWEALMGDAD